MPSNDERREVAARLRENEYGLEHFTLMEILGFDEDAEPYFDGHHRRPERLAEDMRLRLADLIEPEPERTCHIEMIATGNEAAYEHYEHIAHCHSCHHEFGYVLYNEDGDTWQDEKPNYCPNCGAKAVE